MSAVHPQPSAIAPGPIGPGRLVLVVGPSGAGKDTLITGAKAACGHDPAIVFPRRVVTRLTTDAEDHDSLSTAEFDRAVKDGVFAFWWQAHGLKYGIPRTVDDAVRVGRTIICNVSRGIVGDVRTRYVQVDAVLATAPADILSARLSGRSRATDGSLTQRMTRNEGFNAFRADYVIENVGCADAAVQQLLKVIKGCDTPPRG